METVIIRSSEIQHEKIKQSHPHPPTEDGNVLFNNALNTFYLQLYGVRHMLKKHSDSDRKPTATTT